MLVDVSEYDQFIIDCARGYTDQICYNCGSNYVIKNGSETSKMYYCNKCNNYQYWIGPNLECAKSFRRSGILCDRCNHDANLHHCIGCNLKGCECNLTGDLKTEFKDSDAT